MNILFDYKAKGKDKAAFQGSMSCPLCSRSADPTATRIGFESDKQKIKLVGNVGPLMREYKCMKCNGTWRYDINGRRLHPYSSFKRGLKITDPRLRAMDGMKFEKHYIK